MREPATTHLARNLSACEGHGHRLGLHGGVASFDKLRMRSFLRGIWHMPVSIFLMLCSAI
jgi:hypothetical protein